MIVIQALRISFVSKMCAAIVSVTWSLHRYEWMGVQVCWASRLGCEGGVIRPRDSSREPELEIVPAGQDLHEDVPLAPVGDMEPASKPKN
jgi:hypothetical protein